MPIDLNDLRVARGGNPDVIRESEKRRFGRPELVDEIIEMDEVRRARRPAAAGVSPARRARARRTGESCRR